MMTFAFSVRETLTFFVIVCLVCLIGLSITDFCEPIDLSVVHWRLLLVAFVTVIAAFGFLIAFPVIV